MKKIFLFLSIMILSQASLCFAITPEEKKEVLTFVKDYLLLESKNSGIFQITTAETGESRWFELYGILGEVRSKKDVHTVIVDVDVFGYSDQHYLFYFDVQKKDGRWIMVDKRLGPRHDRQLTEDTSRP